MKTYFFPRGGISYEDPFAPSRSSSVTAFLPGLAVIPLIQHPGGKAIPVVSPGETVKEGMLIGRARGPLSANVHATVPGRVLRLVSWTMCDGELNEALLIQMEGEFESWEKKKRYTPGRGSAPMNFWA